MKLKRIVPVAVIALVAVWVYSFYKDSMENVDGKNAIQMLWLADGVLYTMLKNKSIPSDVHAVQAVWSGHAPPNHAPAFGELGKDVWGEAIRFTLDSASGKLVLRSGGRNKTLGDKDDYVGLFTIRDSLGNVLSSLDNAHWEYYTPKRPYTPKGGPSMRPTGNDGQRTR
jgi:hypothetical protein